MWCVWVMSYHKYFNIYGTKQISSQKEEKHMIIVQYDDNKNIYIGRFVVWCWLILFQCIPEIVESIVAVHIFFCVVLYAFLNLFKEWVVCLALPKKFYDAFIWYSFYSHLKPMIYGQPKSNKNLLKLKCVGENVLQKQKKYMRIIRDMQRIFKWFFNIKYTSLKLIV